MTTMTAPHTVPDGDGRPVPEPSEPTDDVTAVSAPEAAEATPVERATTGTRRLDVVMWLVVAVALIGGLTAALVGFGLSYRTLVEASRGWGFGARGSYALPLGVDGAILAFYAIDLVLVWRRMAKPSLRWAAHAMTAVTIALNVDAASGSQSVWAVLQGDPGRIISHAAMPIVFVITVEAVRHLIARTAKLESGPTGTLSVQAWILSPRATWTVWRTAKVWELDYATVREQRRKLAIHRVWLNHREEVQAGLAEGDVSALDRLPEILAPHGISVDEALALPARMRREDQERAHRADRERRELEHEERLAVLAQQAEEIQKAGELDVLRARVEGQREAATHEARAAADTAGIQASAARSAAERAATAEERRAEAQEEAEESARTAAARRKAAEDTKAAVAIEEQNARRRQEAAEAARKAADEEAAAKAKGRQAAEDEEAAAAALSRAAQHRADAARVELVAVAAEDAAGLSPRERTIRRVARLIWTEADGNALRLPLARIEEQFRVTNSTASGYRDEAAQLIRSGYDHRADPLHHRP